MISARRAALLGLNAPLSAIMIAVLGLWPEPDDEAAEIPTTTTADSRGGGDGKPAKKTIEDDEYLVKRRRMKMKTQSIIALICAIAEEAYA